MTTGRFAPSPTGELHLGNLRTALLAWCFARHDGGRFLIRVEDLTTGAEPIGEAQQLSDLAVLGLDHDGEIVRQSERTGAYDAAIDRLAAQGLTYECFCSRREIREAAAAPHGPGTEGAYPGTCAGLDEAQRQARRAEGRLPAIRLRADGAEVGFHDEVHGDVAPRVVDDLVLRRADGIAAYNLAVVVDDGAQGVDQVVRGDDLVDTTPRQVLLQQLLELPTPRYVHVPLVFGPDGERLGKRHGAVGLSGRRAAGDPPERVLGALAHSLGLAAAGESVFAAQVLERFDPATVQLREWVVPASLLEPHRRSVPGAE